MGWGRAQLLWELGWEGASKAWERDQGGGDRGSLRVLNRTASVSDAKHTLPCGCVMSLDCLCGTASIGTVLLLATDWFLALRMPCPHLSPVSCTQSLLQKHVGGADHPVPAGNPLDEGEGAEVGERGSLPADLLPSSVTMPLLEPLSHLLAAWPCCG